MFPENFFRELTTEDVIKKSQFNRIKRVYNSFTQLLNVASTIYKYKGFDDEEDNDNLISCNIERALMLTGFCSFVEKNNKKYPLPFIPSSLPSLDFRPTAGICMGYNGETYNVTALDAPILKNTPFGWSALPAITDYSDRIERIDTTIYGIVKSMQIPYIIRTASPSTKQTIADFIADSTENIKPLIVVEDAIAQTFNKWTEVINTNVDGSTIERLVAYREQAFAEFMRLLGVSSVTNEKRERLLVDEVALSAESGRMLSSPFEISRDENIKLLSKYYNKNITYEKTQNETEGENYEFNKSREMEKFSDNSDK